MNMLLFYAPLIPILFMIGYLIWKETRVLYNDSLIKVGVLLPTGKLRFKIVKTSKDANGVETFAYDGGLYDVPADSECAYRSGLFKVTTYLYVYGNPAPLRLRDGSISEQTADDWKKVQKGSALRNALDSLKESVVTPEMALVIIVGAVLLGNVGVYYMIGQRIDVVIQLVQGATFIGD